MINEFKQVSNERYNIIMSRNCKFQEAMGDLNQEVVKVFDPLNKKQIEELELIREVSKDLQKKKEEDINRAAQAEAESREAVKEAAATAEKEAEQEAEKKAEEDKEA